MYAKSEELFQVLVNFLSKSVHVLFRSNWGYALHIVDATNNKSTVAEIGGKVLSGEISSI